MTTRVVVEAVHAHKVITQDKDGSGTFVTTDEQTYPLGERNEHLYITSTRRVIIEETE